MRLRSKPEGKSALGGYTSTSFTVKSVSTASDDAYSVAVMGPTTVTASARGSVWNTTTSLRADSGR